MSAPLRVLIVTDAFPPLCGGSGWSTFELARALAARGHQIAIVKAEAGASSSVIEEQYESLSVTTYRRKAPTAPVLRNVVKNELVWGELAAWLTDRVSRQPVDVIHAQHVMTTVPSVRTGAAAGIPVVATVRDYWPVCYWSTLIHDPSSATLCPGCSVGMMTRCIRPRSGALWPAALPLIPYMRVNLRTKRRTLARASAVIAVSSRLAADLSVRTPEAAETPLFTIPNPVDLAALDHATSSAPRPLAEPYVLYAGKLAENKGVQFLLPALRRAGLRGPLVIAGDGPLRSQLERDARESHIDARFPGWLDRGAALTWMRHATMLAFPSYGPESLSRVLLEAAALGVPIAAMDTGGTRDIVTPEVTGLLSASPDEFARDLARLWADAGLRSRLGAAARVDVRARFSAASVGERVEHVYRSVVPAGRA